MSYRRDVEDRMENPNLLRDMGINQPIKRTTTPPAAQAASDLQPAMVVPKSIYLAFHGKEQEAWLHGYRTAFERYATPAAASEPRAPVLTDEHIDAAVESWYRNDLNSDRKRMRDAILAAAKEMK